MKKDIRILINESVKEIIEKSSNEKCLKQIYKKHDEKIHFIPKEYRVLGGILQSMNIKFGNFIEILMKNIIAADGKYEIIEEYSGKKVNTFNLTRENDYLIDEYITKCQTSNVDVEKSFLELQKNIHKNENGTLSDNSTTYLKLKHDIDLLYRDKKTNKIYYLEIKYNDDHDTGKFVDINRKFIKTYAYLLNKMHTERYDDIIPILFYFNEKKMKGNIYIPEEKNIMRGSKFFKEFLDIEYLEVQNYLHKLSESDENVQLFNELYRKIMDNKYL